MYYKNIKLCLDDTASYLGTIAYDAGPLLTVCVSFLIFTLSSLILLILLQAKEPVLAFIPRFPPLWGYLMSRSGCEPYALRVYLGIVYLPFGVVLSIVIKQYEPVLAAVVCFIYQAIVLFRRIRLLNRIINKIYDFCSSDLGVREYVRRDYGRFVLSMMSLKQAAENGWLIKRPNGMSYGLLSPYRRGEALRILNLKETEYKSRLLSSEEFMGLSEKDRTDALRSLYYFFNGAREHVSIFVVQGSDRIGMALRLTSSFNDELLSLMVGDTLMRISTELTPLCARWAAGQTDKSQAVISGFSVLQNDDKYPVKNPADRNLNTKFFEEKNLEAIDHAVGPFESILKEVNRLEGKPLLQRQAIGCFNSSSEKLIVPDSVNVFDALD